MKENTIKKIKIAFILVIILTVFIYGLRLDYGQLSAIEISNLEQKVANQYLVKQKINSLKYKSTDIPILVYHSVSPYYPSESLIRKEYDIEPTMFEQQIQYLMDNNYQNISFDELVENLINDKPVPKKAFVITFDDGWKNQYKYAFPILKKYKLTATFFIYTNPIDRSSVFMNWNDVKDLDNSGMTIGDHTESHPLLTSNLDDKTLRTEIIDSKKIIEDHLNKKIDFFAYPFYTYTPSAMAIVEEAGFKAARGGYSLNKNNIKNIFTLRSIQVPTNIDDFIKDLN